MSFRRQVTSVRVTESWRPQLGLAGPLSRVDTDALVPLRRPAGRLWSHATAEPFSDKVIRGGVQGRKIHVGFLPITSFQMLIDLFRTVVSRKREAVSLEKGKSR